jgi:hypothetical protein
LNNFCAAATLGLAGLRAWLAWPFHQVYVICEFLVNFCILALWMALSILLFSNGGCVLCPSKGMKNSIGLLIHALHNECS